MTERGKRAPRKPSAALTAALAQIAALQLENLTVGDLKEKVAALEHDVERKWQPTELELRARIAEKIIPCPGFFLIRPAPISRNIRRRRCEPKAHLLHLAASTLAMANV